MPGLATSRSPARELNNLLSQASNDCYRQLSISLHPPAPLSVMLRNTCAANTDVAIDWFALRHAIYEKVTNINRVQ